MMISPETYYEVHLKGKTIEEIQKAIRRLKKEMDYLKNTMENPQYSDTVLESGEKGQL